MLHPTASQEFAGYCNCENSQTPQTARQSATTLSFWHCVGFQSVPDCSLPTLGCEYRHGCRSPFRTTTVKPDRGVWNWTRGGALYRRMGSRFIFSPKEFDLLAYLLQHQGEPVIHARFLRAVGGPVSTARATLRNLGVNWNTCAGTSRCSGKRSKMKGRSQYRGLTNWTRVLARPGYRVWRAAGVRIQPPSEYLPPALEPSS